MKIIAAAALVAASIMASTVAPTAAKAQYYGTTVTCEARSAVAFGAWTHANGNYACQRALEECAVRTPYGYNCYVTRYWYN